MGAINRSILVRLSQRPLLAYPIQVPRQSLALVARQVPRRCNGSATRHSRRILLSRRRRKTRYCNRSWNRCFPPALGYRTSGFESRQSRGSAATAGTVISVQTWRPAHLAPRMRPRPRLRRHRWLGLIPIPQQRIFIDSTWHHIRRGHAQRGGQDRILVPCKDIQWRMWLFSGNRGRGHRPSTRRRTTRSGYRTSGVDTASGGYRTSGLDTALADSSLGCLSRLLRRAPTLLSVTTASPEGTYLRSLRGNPSRQWRLDTETAPADLHGLHYWTRHSDRNVNV